MWQYRGLEPLLDRWEAEDRPDGATREAVYLWLMALLEDPRPASCALVPGSQSIWIGEVPGTGEVVVLFLYQLVEDEKSIWGLALDTV